MIDSVDFYLNLLRIDLYIWWAYEEIKEFD